MKAPRNKEQISISRWKFIPSDSDISDSSWTIKVVINENTKGTLRCNLLKLSKITGISDHKNVRFMTDRDEKKRRQNTSQFSNRTAKKKKIKYLDKGEIDV